MERTIVMNMSLESWLCKYQFWGQWLNEPDEHEFGIMRAESSWWNIKSYLGPLYDNFLKHVRTLLFIVNNLYIPTSILPRNLSLASCNSLEHVFPRKYCFLTIAIYESRYNSNKHGHQLRNTMWNWMELTLKPSQATVGTRDLSPTPAPHPISHIPHATCPIPYPAACSLQRQEPRAKLDTYSVVGTNVYVRHQSWLLLVSVLLGFCQVYLLIIRLGLQVSYLVTGWHDGWVCDGGWNRWWVCEEGMISIPGCENCVWLWNLIVCEFPRVVWLRYLFSALLGGV